jgi:hypothetical protein
MFDASVLQDVRAACVDSTGKAWFSALARWEALLPVTGTRIAGAFLAEATLKVGRLDQAAAYAALIPKPMQSLDSIAALSRAIAASAAGATSASADPEIAGAKALGGVRFEAALHRWGDAGLETSREAPLRLAQAAYGLGEYELAKAIAMHGQALGGLATEADRYKSLLDSSQRGIERCRRLGGQPVNALPHPIIRDLRAMFSQDDETDLSALT